MKASCTAQPTRFGNLSAVTRRTDTDVADFGRIIREQRKHLGLTQARLAELVGRGPGEIRSWEAGRQVPTQPEVLSTLAAILAVNQRQLFEAAGVEIPASRPQETIEQSLASIAPAEKQASPPIPSAPRPQPIARVRAPQPVVTPSYVEDREQRLTYKLRGAFTAIGLFGLLAVFAWAASQFFDALGDAWDAVFGNL